MTRGGGIWSTAITGKIEVFGSTFCANTVDHIAGAVVDLGNNSYAATCGEPCPSDLTGDGYVGGADLAALLGSWGNLGGPEDINEDGVVSGADLAILLGDWGSCG